MNQSYVRIIPLTIETVEGTAVVDLAEQGIDLAAMLVPSVDRTDAVVHVMRPTPSTARVQVTTYGRTIAPLPWNGLREPITVRLMAAWQVPTTDQNREQVAKVWTLEAGLSHTIKHDLNTRRMIESIRGAAGETVYAGLTVIDENTIRVDLTEAVPVTVSVMFLV